MSVRNPRSRWKLVIFFVVLALISYAAHMHFRAPPGLEAMGGNDETIAKLGLWTAIAAALGAFFSLLKEVVSLFKNK